MAKALRVRYVDLPDMTVASALGLGKEPEDLAFRMIQELALRLGIEPASAGHELYGFNNPNPSSGSETYGYELWMRIEPGTEVASPLEVKEVPACSYAVTRLTGLSNIGRVWKELAGWYERHERARTPSCQSLRWLESLQNPAEPDVESWIFDLYLALSKPQGARS